MGISTLLGAKKVIVVGWGETISPYVRQAIEAPASDTVPASFLQSHKESKFVLDLSSAEHLTRLSTPWLVTSCEWDDKLIRRAIVWLCRITGKPILKLTNKDYNDNGLSELLALFGSAYNVNIKIFNDLQHTITGGRVESRMPMILSDPNGQNLILRKLLYSARILMTM